jgi:translation initiation factor 5A
MAFKLISATEAKSGAAILVEGVACIVRSNDISKTGKHGHAKCRIEAIGIIDGKKKVFVTGGHERLEVPMINKNKGQVLNITGETASIMDLESYETLDSVPIIEDVKEGLSEGDQVEYWDIEGSKIIKRKL